MDTKDKNYCFDLVCWPGLGNCQVSYMPPSLREVHEMAPMHVYQLLLTVQYVKYIPHMLGFENSYV